MENDPSSLYRNVIAAVDGSELADRALTMATVLSAAVGADLHVVAVAHSDDQEHELRTHIDGALAARGATASAVVERSDTPADAICEVADRLADPLVCMGSHGRGRVAGAALGSVAAAVLRQGNEPVLVTGPACADRPVLEPYRIVACLDGAPGAERVLPEAVRWADALGMELSLLTVAEPAPDPIRDDVTGFRGHGPDRPEAYLEATAARLASGARRMTTHAVYDPIGPADGVRTHLRTDPATVVAVTTHARQGLARAVLGSQAARIVHDAPAPVLVVPPAEPA